ncbi:hypothetical protein K1T71_006712 [Dendrolimus kikuchii]|uniref:Uncharacterized protein n=1 Tax=Dendrolimus kikuchii TaxID=765133 RepID=A0ACC1D1J6_9NEOP|nr:hypothetical protein K1T71_006712 [Dendrolimus kikuchii]
MPPKRREPKNNDNESLSTPSGSIHEPEVTMMTQNITMSCDMLQTLVANIITQNQSENNRILLEQLLQTATPRTPTVQSSNFAQCTARFHGTSGNMDELEAFIETIEIYKECTNISDDHALRGLPMLLVDDATV